MVLMFHCRIIGNQKLVQKLCCYFKYELAAGSFFVKRPEWANPDPLGIYSLLVCAHIVLVL